MIALRLHLRTSPLRWALIPMTALALAVLLLRPDYWIGSWGETGAAGQLPVFFLGIIAAGASAWTSGSTARHNLGEITTAAALPVAKTESYRLGATALLLLVPYLSCQAVAFTLTARTFPPGVHLWLGYTLMGLVAMLMAISWGWAVGRVLSAVYGALVASLSWLMFEGLVDVGARLGVVSGPTWTQPDVVALTVRFVAVAAFCSILVWTSRRQIRPPSWRSAALPAAGAALVVAATLGTTGVADRDVPHTPLCVDGQILMCLWPEDEKYLPMIRALDARASGLPNDFRLPARMDQYGLERQKVTLEGRVSVQLEGDFDISEGDTSALALGMSNVIISETLDRCDWDAIFRAEDRGPEALRRWVELYLNGGRSPGYRTSGLPDDIAEAWDVAANVSAMPPPRQRDWVREEIDRVNAGYCGK